MKLYAQHGYGEGDKIRNGLNSKYISGVIFSPRDISPQNLLAKLNEYSGEFPEAELLLDPQYYACLYSSHPNLNLGKLNEYQTSYFEFQTKNKLELEKNVFEILGKSISFQHTIPTSSIITPNILIPRSFDSREAVIAKNFIRLAKSAYKKKSSKKSIYCSIVVSNDAIRKVNELQEFLNDITLIDEPPDGYYLLISYGNSDAKAEIFNPDTIAAWMLINYSLKINGYKVINGYSDLISPLLCSVGADICSTGWWANLRNFSITRFTPTAAGGRLPVQRYLSKSLINRITFYEYDALKERVKGIKNELPTDQIYENGEPERAAEILQSWNALSTLCSEFSSNSVVDNLNVLKNRIDNAFRLYATINSILPLETKSNSEHIEPLQFAISRFLEFTEL